MATFSDFAAQLFPGDDIIERNPTDVPDAIRPLLEEVASCTQIQLDWIERAANLVVEGLAGLQCLWYLHGLQGEVVQKSDRLHGLPYSFPEPLRIELLALLQEYELAQFAKAMKKLKTSEARDKKLDHYLAKHEMDWGAGYVEFHIFDNIKPRRMKIGKWLSKMDASADLMKTFETRDMPSWHWEISCNPYDILTMSHKRAWTSCMRPHGEFEYGPLTDMAAGSAIMFFFRPGADEPCGRRILRPAVSQRDEPMVLDGGRTYGCGPAYLPELTPKQLRDVVLFQDRSLCPLGDDGRALSRFIYSDIEHEDCGQDSHDYALAYATLDSLPWPEISLDFTTIGAVAEEFRGILPSIEDTEREEDARVNDLVANIFDEFAAHNPWPKIWESLTTGAVFRKLFDKAALRERINTQRLYDRISTGVKGLLMDYLVRHMQEAETFLYVLDVKDPGGNTLFNRLYWRASGIDIREEDLPKNFKQPPEMPIPESYQEPRIVIVSSILAPGDLRPDAVVPDYRFSPELGFDWSFLPVDLLLNW
jgi:hypothetical protein